MNGQNSKWPPPKRVYLYNFNSRLHRRLVCVSKDMFLGSSYSLKYSRKLLKYYLINMHGQNSKWPPSKPVFLHNINSRLHKRLVWVSKHMFFGVKLFITVQQEQDISICYIFTNFKIAANKTYFLITLLEDFKGTLLSVSRFIKAL